MTNQRDLEDLEKQLRDNRDENRFHQFEYVKTADQYARTLIRSMLVINTGSIGLIPVYIEKFEYAPDMAQLEWGISFFILSIVSIFLTMLFAYISASAGATTSIHQASAEQIVIRREHLKNTKKITEEDAAEPLDDLSNQYNKKRDKNHNLAIRFELIALLCIFLAIVLFAFGALLSIKAF